MLRLESLLRSCVNGGWPGCLKAAWPTSIDRSQQVSTLVCLNVVMVMCVAALACWLGVSIMSYPFLIPHVGFLLFMAVGLWILVNWFVLNAGLVDPEKQKQELGLGEDVKIGAEREKDK